MLIEQTWLSEFGSRKFDPRVIYPKVTRLPARCRRYEDRSRAAYGRHRRVPRAADFHAPL
jgi:hypothetical protein